jgi:hypothetical protein
VELPVSRELLLEIDASHEWAPECGSDHDLVSHSIERHT